MLMHASFSFTSLHPLSVGRRCCRMSSYALTSSDVDLDWKVTYVGSAASPEYDQELESVLVGPVPIGISKFVLAVCSEG
jgi:hypothetical protein